MPSLKALLNETMLFVAARGVDVEPTEGGPEFSAPAVPAAEVSDSAAATLPIWHWTTSQPSTVDQVTCIARGIGNARMLVCEQIRFTEVFVQVEGKGAVPLDLNAQFLVKSFGLERGKIASFDPVAPRPGSHFLYPLEAEVDKSYLHVLVYVFPDGVDNPPVAVDPAVLDTADFMPSPGGDPMEVEGGQSLTITLVPIRVLVFVSLVCCKERADFDPGGMLGAGRMVPHLMIMCNRPLVNVHGVVHLKRPSTMKMLEGGDHSLHAAMNDKLEIGLWGDCNDVPGIPIGPFTPPVILDKPSPFWDDLFDCYLLGNANNTVKDRTGATVNTAPFTVVRPEIGARSIIEAVENLNDASTFLGPRPYEAVSIERVARQGCFDNLHVAPTMRSDVQPPGHPSHLKTPADVTRFYGLDRVFMAPFCEHDCLHTHWRWGTNISKRQPLGWSAPSQSAELVLGKPHLVAGAPMVPHNQEIRIDITGTSSFMYRARAGTVVIDMPEKVPIAPGTFTCINLHGSGYAVSVGAIFPVLVQSMILAAGSRDEPLIGVVTDSATFYWHLRFGGNSRLALGDIVQERTRFRDMAKVLHD